MKLWDIIKTIGTGLVASTPAGAAIMGAVNMFLPDDKQLPANATGQEVESAIQSLPASDRARIMEKEIDVELTAIKESHSTVRAMLESEVKSPHTTRPYIAKQSFHVIAFTIIVTVCLWAYGVAIQDIKLVKAVMEGWPFILAVCAPLVVLLRAYFGVLKAEHKNRLDAAGGNQPTQPTGFMGLLSALVKG